MPTFVTIGELTKWTLVRHWGPIRRDQVRTFLDAMVTLPYGSLVAARWGEIQAYAQLRRPALPGERFVDRRLLPWCATFRWSRSTPKDYIDFVEHEGLRTLT